MINTVIVSGHLGMYPRITNFENGGKAAQFSIAVTERGYKRQDGSEVPDRTDWFNIETGRSGIAGIVEKFLKKGSWVTVQGSLRNREWEKDGVKHSRTVIQIENLDLPPRNGEQSNSTPPPSPEQPKATSNSNSNPATVKNDNGETQPSDDLPF